MKTTFANLQPGDRFNRMMKRWEVIEVGERLPNDTRRPIRARRTDAPGEERIFNIRDYSTVHVMRPSRARCPHCTFEGSETEVDDHRATGVHNDEPQAGSNL